MSICQLLMRVVGLIERSERRSSAFLFCKVDCELDGGVSEVTHCVDRDGGHCEDVEDGARETKRQTEVARVPK